MLASTLKRLAHALPFEPFVIQMNDGRKFEIRHPDFVTVSPQGLSIYVFDSEDDGATHLSSLLVASVKTLPRRKRRSAAAHPRRQSRR